MALAPTATPLERLRAVVELEPKRLSEHVSEQVRASDPKRAQVLRGDLDTLVARALKKTPAERYANAAALADDVRRWLAHEPLVARPDSAIYRLSKFVRRHRLGVAAGGVAALALAAGIGVVVWEARKTEHQRVQAEGLIEFMLGDLRKKLEPVGRLDVMDSVGAKALAFYAQQDAGALDADSLGRRARALHLLGEIAEKRGNLDEAERMFRRAADSTATLLARQPRAEQPVYDHAQSVYWIGYIAWQRGQVPEAETQFTRYLTLAEQLTSMAPANLDWRNEQAAANMNLGVLLMNVGRATEALPVLSRAIGLWQGMVDVKPALRFEMATALGWQAKAQEQLGQYAMALQLQQRKLTLFPDPTEAQSSSRVRKLLANGSFEISGLHLALGHLDDAANNAVVAVAAYQALQAGDPDNLDWQAQWCSAQLRLAQIRWNGGQLTAARQQLAAIKPVLDRLLAQDKSKALWHVYLQGQAATLQVRLNSSPDALQAYLADLPRFEQGGKSLKAEHARVAAEAQLLLGDRLVERHDRAAARQQWLAVAQRMQAASARGDADAMALWALAQQRLGLIQEARAVAEKLRASAYRHPRYAELQQRL